MKTGIPETVKEFAPNIPSEWGYYWLTKSSNKEPELVSLSPGKNYKDDHRSVEIWECPGIGRTYLDLHRLPRWKWQHIPQPK
jgi:hypothetical protein